MCWGNGGRLGGLIMITILVNIEEGEKGPACALLRGFGKMLDWDLAFV